MGPVMCCWFDYWRTAPGPADGSGEDFLGWFLRQVHDHDVANGVRTLDVLDVHYYPQGDVFNDQVDDRDGRPAAAQHALAVGPDVHGRVVGRRSASGSSHACGMPSTPRTRAPRSRSASGTWAPMAR